APAGEHGEVLRLGRLRARALAPAGDDGLAQGMLAARLHARRQAVELRLVQRGVKAADGGDLGPARRQRAGLVEADAADPGQPLQRVALADQEAVLRRVADGGHDGRRRRQHEGAGAEDDEDGDGAEYLARDGPGDARRQQARDHDPGGTAVRKADDLGLARVRGLDKAYHALYGAVLAHLGRAHVEGAELIHRAAGHLVARGLVHGQALAGHDGLVHGGDAGDDDAVHGYGLARQDAQ